MQSAGANVHLVAPSKVGAFDNRRVKNDQRDCQLLGDLLRANMLPEAWISTLQVRQWRELVRYRARMVGLRSGLKTQVHAVLAKHGIQVAVSDLFGVGGRELLGHLVRDDPRFRSAYGQRVESLLVLIDGFDHEIDEVSSSIKRGPITKQGGRLVRWAAVEAAQKLRTGSVLHQRREHLAEQRNSRKIAKVAIARRIVTLVSYGLRDGTIRCLQPAA